MNKRNIILLLFFILANTLVEGQDTLILMNGKKLPVKSVELHEYNVDFRTFEKSSKLKKMDVERVFSVVYKNGTEKVIYQSDSLDPIDFSVNEMRMFLRGMQDARQFYRNRPVVTGGFFAGVVSGFFGFYGILGPPMYATFFGSFSPNVNKRMSFKVGGQASQTAGIESKKFLNNVTGTVASPQFGNGQVLRINSHKITVSGPIDSAVTTINERFKSHLVHASNTNGQLTLYRSNDPNLLAQNAYREGFEKRARDHKIRKSALAGLIGLVMTTTVAIIAQ